MAAHDFHSTFTSISLFFFFFALKFAPCLGMKLGVVFCIVHSEL